MITHDQQNIENRSANGVRRQLTIRLSERVRRALKLQAELEDETESTIARRALRRELGQIESR